MKRFLKSLAVIRSNIRQVLSMNERNLHYVYPYNHRRYFPIADNKLETKKLLATLDIPVPKTYQTYQYFYELTNLLQDLGDFKEFVIKPASGSGGGGIVVIVSRSGDCWYTLSGTEYSIDDLRRHISDIIFGVYANGLNDQAIIEQRLQQHAAIEHLSPHGLADVRIIYHKHQPILAMIRLATKDSNGTANLHQGAVGVGIDIDSGKTTNAIYQREFITEHPDTAVDLIGHSIPHWPELVAIGARIAEHTPLKYIGIDIAVTDRGPFLLEINARPGIEIQNANASGMCLLLEQA